MGLPRDGELENALEGASYQLIRRSGFISSDTYAEELRKKKIYMCLQPGHALNIDLKEISMMFRTMEVIRYIVMQSHSLWGCRYEGIFKNIQDKNYGVISDSYRIRRKINKKEYIYLPRNHQVLIPDIEKMYGDLQKKVLEKRIWNICYRTAAGDLHWDSG